MSTNTGASLTGITLIVTTPATDVQTPSLTVNEKLSVPLKSSIGVLIGFLASSLIKFVTCIVYLMIYLMQFWEYIN